MSRLNDERFEDEPPTLPKASKAPEPVPTPSARAYYSHAPLPGPAPRTSPLGRLLTPPAREVSRKPTTPGLGAVRDPFPATEAPTPTVDNAEAWLVREGQRLLRNWRACPPDRRRQLSAMALSYREDAEGKDRKT
jgi:hypothetical protein